MRPEPSFARSVVAWGNACLRHELELARFDAWCSSTGFVRALEFRNGDSVTGGAEWLASQRDVGAARLWLDAGAYVGAERIIVCSEQPRSAWRQAWQRIPGASSPPWFDATFSHEAPPTAAPAPGQSVTEVLRALCSALEGLVELGSRADLQQWSSYFERVLAVARGAQTEGTSPLPPTAPAEAHRLALAANLADVFGGMGSWNDFEPLADPALEDERGRHSSALHHAMRAALEATAHA